MLTVGELMEAARCLQSLADLAPARYAGLAGEARELATQLSRACAAVQQAAVVAVQRTADEVRQLRAEVEAWKELAAVASETLHNPADMRPELIGTGEAGLWRITQDVGSMLCRGPVLRPQT